MADEQQDFIKTPFGVRVFSGIGGAAVGGVFGFIGGFVTCCASCAGIGPFMAKMFAISDADIQSLGPLSILMGAGFWSLVGALILGYGTFKDSKKFLP